MTTQSTMDKLIEMRLTAMSDAFRTQISDPEMKEISFEDRFGMLVDIEYSNRKSNSLKRLIRNAGFDQPDAYIGDINYTSGRKLNRSLIERLATCEYITEHRNLFITGATGERQDLSGMCVRDGSMQAALQNEVCTASGSAPGTGDGT